MLAKPEIMSKIIMDIYNIYDNYIIAMQFTLVFINKLAIIRILVSKLVCFKVIANRI